MAQPAHISSTPAAGFGYSYTLRGDERTALLAAYSAPLRAFAYAWRFR